MLHAGLFLRAIHDYVLCPAFLGFGFVVGVMGLG